MRKFLNFLIEDKKVDRVMDIITIIACLVFISVSVFASEKAVFGCYPNDIEISRLASETYWNLREKDVNAPFRIQLLEEIIETEAHIITNHKREVDEVMESVQIISEHQELLELEKLQESMKNDK